MDQRIVEGTIELNTIGSSHLFQCPRTTAEDGDM